MYDIGPYTFAPWKVVWKRTTRAFEAAVVADLPIHGHASGVVVPNDKVMLIGLDDADEAYYVCGVINSSLARARINASISSEAHAEILGLVTLPSYVRDETQKKIAQLSSDCHVAAASGDEASLRQAEFALDLLVAELWGVDEEDVRQAQSSLVQGANTRTRAGSRPVTRTGSS
jgi:hypothetical protein